jgi:hypothetical protein
MPFDGKTLYDLLNNIMVNKYEKIPGHYTEEVNKLIEILLKVNPDERPTCEEILNLPAIKKVQMFIEDKYKPIFDWDKYDYNLSEVSIVSELSFTSSLEERLVEFVRNDSPRLLRPKTPSPEPVVVRPKTPSPPPPPPKPRTPSPPPPPKPKEKVKRYFQNVDRKKLEKMFYGQLKKFRTKKYGKEIRPFGWNRNFKIGKIEKGYHGIVGANLGGMQRETPKWKEKGVIGLLDSFYLNKREKYELKTGRSRTVDGKSLGTSRYIDQDKLEHYVQNFEDDIKNGMYDGDKPDSYKSVDDRSGIRRQKRDLRGNRLGYNMGRNEINLYQEFKKNQLKKAIYSSRSVDSQIKDHVLEIKKSQYQTINTGLDSQLLD